MLLDARPRWPDHVYLSDFGLSKEAAGSGADRNGVVPGHDRLRGP
jgi:hypothetical protein